MKPLLAHVYEPHRVTYPLFCQPKLNGIRALYQNGFFQSRDEVPFTPGLLDHLAKPLLEIFGPEVILDGELYVHGWPLQRINAVVTPVRQEPTEDTKLVEYHVFDKIDFKTDFWTRWKWLHENVSASYVCFSNKVNVVKTVKVFDIIESDTWYATFVSLGYEGMMYRLGDCPYTVPKQPNNLKWVANHRTPFLSDQDNRVWHLLKRKDWQDDEFECIGIQEGEGKYVGTLGAFICRNTNQCKTTGCRLISFSVGSGVTDLERAHYFTNPPIGHLIKVKYLCLSSDGIPLNPTILAVL